MSGIVAGVLIFVLGLLIGELFLRDERVSRRASWIILATALGVFAVGYALPLRGLVDDLPRDVDPWHVFHYDLNARYFSELGYFSLYSCALQADAEGARQFDRVGMVRDLRTYQLVPRAQLSPCPRERFSEERWQSFKMDVQGIRTTLPIPTNPEYRHWQGQEDAYWQAIFQDKGHNLTPAGIRLTTYLFSLSPDNRWTQWAMLLRVELLMLIAAIIVVGCVWSLRAAALFALWLVTFWGTYPFLLNMLLQHIWLPLTIFGLATWQKQKPKTAIALITLAGMLRVFPFLFLFPLLTTPSSKEEGLGEEKAGSLGSPSVFSHFKNIIRVPLLSTTLITIVTVVLLTLPIAPWFEYGEKLSAHRSYLIQEVFHIGWSVMVQQYLGSSPVLFWGGAGLFTLLVLYATRRAQKITQVVLMIAFLFAGLALAPYYYLVLAFLALLQTTLAPRYARISAFAVIIVFLIHAITGTFGLAYFSENRNQHLISQVLIALLLLFHLGLVWCSSKARSIDARPGSP